MDDLLTREQTAREISRQFFEISHHELANLSYRGKGPACQRIGRPIFYCWRSAAAWAREQVPPVGWLTRREMTDRLRADGFRIGISALARVHSLGTGPAARKFGKFYYYDPAVVIDWIKKKTARKD